MNLSRILLGTICVAAAVTFALGDGAATPKAAEAGKADPSVQIGEIRVQTLPEQTYFYGSAETTFDAMPDTVSKLMAGMMDLENAGKVNFRGGAVFVYKGVKDMKSPFMLEVGFATKEGTKDQGAFKVRKLEAIHCATILFCGPLSHLKEGYDKLMKGMAEKGLTPAGESREAYLVWEGPESENNVVQLQMAIAPGK